MSFDWSVYKQATCMPDNCFCEPVGDGLIRQPIDTYTNIPLILVGIYMILFLLKHKYLINSNTKRLGVKSLYILGISYVVVGIGSFFYHATFTFIGQELDLIGMYLIIVFMLLYSLSAFVKFKPRSFFLSYLLIVTVLSLVILILPEIRRHLFALFLVFAVISEILVIKIQRPIIKTQLFILGIITFIVAYLFNALDDLGVLCNPSSLFQGHSVWHLLTGLAGLIIFHYALSEFEARGEKVE